MLLETGQFVAEIAKEIPIPELKSVSGWKEIPIAECGEALVPVGLFTKYDKIITDAIYFGWTNASPYQTGELGGVTLSVFMREGVAKKLDQISKHLPRNIKLIVFDAFRPLEVQKSLYDQYFSQLWAEHEDWSEDDLSRETQRFVSLPSENPLRPSPHNSGGAVDVGLVRIDDEHVNQISHLERQMAAESDGRKLFGLEVRRLALIKQSGTLLNYGTNFDFGGERAGLAYFEKLKSVQRLNKDEQEALKNRRWLYWQMILVGLQAYPDEWWHYNDKASQMGARTAGLKVAKYGRADLNQVDLEFDSLVQKALVGLGLMSRVVREGQTLFDPESFNLALDAIGWKMDWRNFAPAERIKPE